jgi:hypothetical protein
VSAFDASGPSTSRDNSTTALAERKAFLNAEFRNYLIGVAARTTTVSYFLENANSKFLELAVRVHKMSRSAKSFLRNGFSIK